MSKIKILETKKDLFRLAIGSSPLVARSNDGISKFVYTEQPGYKVSVMSSIPSFDDGISGEEVKILIRPNGNTSVFQTNLRRVISENVNFTDHLCEIITPINNEEVKDLPATQGLSMYKCDTQFAYVAEDYDALQLAIEEINLPTIFEDKRRQDFIDFKKDRKPAPIDLNPISARRYENVIFPARPVVDGIYKRIPNEFPYYNRISISSNTKTDLTDFLNKTDIFYFLLNDYINTDSPSISFDLQSDGLVIPTEVPVFSLNSWVTGTSFAVGENVFISDKVIAANSKIKRDLKKLLFAGYLNKLSQSFRNFTALMNREFCYNEEVAYTLDKYQNFAIDPKVQRLVMPAVENESVFNDTQIKYGQTYVYVCNGHYVIVGNRYRYENLTFHNLGTDEVHATVTVKNYPNVVLVPLQFFDKTLKVIQPPPLFPQVKIFTENNSEKQIQFYLSPTKGKAEGEFIPILDTDKKIVEDLSQYFKDPENIKFETIPEDGSYEIFRTDKPPESYVDFSDSKVGEVNIQIASTDALFVDNVIPNKKYYYCFRKLNSKGLVSNPTTIYEVELIIDADDAKVIVKDYHIPEPILFNNSRSFARLFQITPAVEQTVFDSNQEASAGKPSLKGTVDNLRLGVAKETLWGRKLKFRVKSNVTGKIIDYNIDFTLTKNKTQEDF